MRCCGAGSEGVAGLSSSELCILYGSDGDVREPQPGTFRSGAVFKHARPIYRVGCEDTGGFGVTLGADVGAAADADGLGDGPGVAIAGSASGNPIDGATGVVPPT